MEEVNRAYWEQMYELPLEDIPWEIKEAPAELREYVEHNRIENGEALDAGCGTGNFSVYLARNGFRVTGVDYSEKALAIARRNNEAAKLPIDYIRADLTKLADAVGEKRFDLILDYKVCHHLDQKRFEQYAADCIKLLKPSGRMLLICYSDKDVDAAGNASAIGKFGNEMHYRSAQEIRDVFVGLREVQHAEVMLGKNLNHAGHCFVFEKSA